MVQRCLWRRACETPSVEYGCSDCAESFVVSVSHVKGDEYGVEDGVCLRPPSLTVIASQKLLKEAAHVF
jgi:hypothetical protein